MSGTESLTPAQRTLRARIASHTSWAATEDRTGRTRNGRDAAWRKFEDQVDPGRLLSPEERYKRAKSAQSARMAAIAYKSVAARQAKTAGKTK